MAKHILILSNIDKNLGRMVSLLTEFQGEEGMSKLDRLLVLMEAGMGAFLPHPAGGAIEDGGGKVLQLELELMPRGVQACREGNTSLSHLGAEKEFQVVSEKGFRREGNKEGQVKMDRSSSIDARTDSEVEPILHKDSPKKRSEKIGLKAKNKAEAEEIERLYRDNRWVISHLDISLRTFYRHVHKKLIFPDRKIGSRYYYSVEEVQNLFIRQKAERRPLRKMKFLKKEDLSDTAKYFPWDRNLISRYAVNFS